MIYVSLLFCWIKIMESSWIEVGRVKGKAEAIM